jgi:hypothetical protein
MYWVCILSSSRADGRRCDLASYKSPAYYGPVWYSFMSSFTSSFTTSIGKQPILCPTLWSASLKTHSHRVKHMVKLQKHGSLSPAHEVAHEVVF